MGAIVELIRLEESDQGTLGVLRVNKEIFCYTLELPNRNNEREKSCIPVGQYLAKPVLSTKFGKTWEVCNVPGRSGILFHAGNTVADTRGCVLVGSTIGKLRGDRAVLNSGVTFKAFAETIGVANDFKLSVVEYF